MANAFKKRSKLLDVVKNMPPLHHTIPNEEFDIKKSEVVKWLISQPDILNWIWNNIKQSGDVIYDKDTGEWRGVDFESEDK